MGSAERTERGPVPTALLPTHRDLYYGGDWHAPRAGVYRETINPALGEPLGSVAEAGPEDVEEALRTARAAFVKWQAVKPGERAEMLSEAAASLRARAEEFPMIDALNTGNPVAVMMRDAGAAAAGIDFFAGLVTEVKGGTIPMGRGTFNYTVREPLGVVARIVAYNHPAMFAAVKIGAPLATGNTVVIKPPEQAPLSALRMAELIGGIFPPGVLNVLPGGKECGQALASHPLVAKITLIGSVPTGKAVLRAGADTLKPVLLELGGKNALIAYPDADLEKTISGAVEGMNFTWAGQSCGSTSRAFLHESIHDRVIEGIVRLIVQRHKPGIPTDWSTTMGPVVSQAQFDKVMQYIRWGVEDGARLVLGGKRPEDPALAKGFFVEPTVFADVTPSMRIAREEIFGPVLSVFRWKEEEELFEQVNAVDCGLTASIWTRDLVTAHRAASRRGTCGSTTRARISSELPSEVTSGPGSAARSASRSSSSSPRSRTSTSTWKGSASRDLEGARMYEFRTQRTVEFADTDMGGVVHFARYFVFMESAEHEFIASLGGGVVRAGPNPEYFWPRLTASCDYKSSARFRDLLDIHLRVQRKGETSLTYGITFRRNGEEVAVGKLVTVCCVRDPGGRFVPVPISADLAQRIAQAPERT